MVFVVVFTLAIAVAVTSSYFIFSQNQQQKMKTINSFEDCAKHYPVMESYPEQCKTPDGKHFTRELTEAEKSRVVNPTEILQTTNKDSRQNTYINEKWKYQINYPQEWEVKGGNLDDVIFTSNSDAKGKGEIGQIFSKQMQVTVVTKQKPTLEEEAKLIGMESLQCSLGSPCEGKPAEEILKNPDGSIYVKSVSGYYSTLYPLKGKPNLYLAIRNSYPFTEIQKSEYEEFVSTFKFSE